MTYEDIRRYRRRQDRIRRLTAVLAWVWVLLGFVGAGFLLGTAARFVLGL